MTTNRPADQLRFHSERAMRELDMAARAAHPVAARAHLALSDLHLQRMRFLAADSEAALGAQS